MALETAVELPIPVFTGSLLTSFLSWKCAAICIEVVLRMNEEEESAPPCFASPSSSKLRSLPLADGAPSNSSTAGKLPMFVALATKKLSLNWPLLL